jgi:hypothetical protein
VGKQTEVFVRRAVIEALDGEHVHLSAEQVHAAAKCVVP